jgi:Tfp pilus assembly protein PilF
MKDLEGVVASDPNYDFQRAPALLAHAYANTGRPEKAGEIFAAVAQTSTASETYYNYALFLQSRGRKEEAKQWAQRLLDKKYSMPTYLRRRERPWFWKAKLLLKRLQ